MSSSRPPSSSGSGVDTNSGAESADNITDVKAARFPSAQSPSATAPAQPAPKEIGGRDGPEPTRFGDWEKGGRCIDF
jgi:hypothetical protein